MIFNLNRKKGIVEKRFNEWIELKEKIHSNNYNPPFVSERDIWWISFGENVGSEMNGKSKLFSRPGIILKKLARNFYLIAPTTSQERKGTWYTNIEFEDKEMYVCLHQIRTVDFRRLSTRLGRIGDSDFNKIKNGFKKLYL